MKRSLLVLLLLTSWIVGLSLICLFPPDSDFSGKELNLGCVSEDSLPKPNLKNSNRLRTVPEIEEFSGIEALAPLVSDAVLDQTQWLLPWSAQPLIDFESVFDVRILFRKFFETF